MKGRKLKIKFFDNCCISSFANTFPVLFLKSLNLAFWVSNSTNQQLNIRNWIFCKESAENMSKLRKNERPLKTCSQRGLENHIAFPPFSRVLDIDCNERRGAFYYSVWNGEHVGMLRPTRHWCVMGEIEMGRHGFLFRRSQCRKVMMERSTISRYSVCVSSARGCVAQRLGVYHGGHDGPLHAEPGKHWKCKVVKYCSRECQVAAWQLHKMLCAQMDVCELLWTTTDRKKDNNDLHDLQHCKQLPPTTDLRVSHFTRLTYGARM